MDTLNALYNLPLRQIKFTDRKFDITAAKTLIIGTSGSGKTSLITEYLRGFKAEERLYINLADIRINDGEIFKNLAAFLALNKEIKALAIDNLNQKEQILNLTEILPLNLENIVIATQMKTLVLPDFQTLNLQLLDYEEFIAFFRKNFDPDTLFSQFLSHGRSVNSAFLESGEVAENLQNRLKKNLTNINVNLIKECAAFQGLNLSSYELYKNLKERIKISKDSVYSGLAELENLGYIAFVSKFNEPNAAKKLYFEDFAMRNALSFKKDFAKNFANVVFCELFKFKEQIFYTKEFDFFLAKRKLAIITSPFSDSELAFLKFKKLHPNLKSIGATKLQIITMSNFGEQSIDGIRCEVIPFSRWALGID